jgi:hypothetical protein
MVRKAPWPYALTLLEPGTPGHDALLAYINLPMPESISVVYQEPAGSAHMRENYPGLEEQPTLGNMIRTFWAKNKALQETDVYKTLRETVQHGLGINKDKMFASNAPFSEMHKRYENITQVAAFDINNVLRNDLSPVWFQDISHRYLMLDIHGYQQDKVKVDGKNKDTMRNTIDDGFHAAFASTCDFYITNDTRALKKTIEVYDKLNINTRVMTPVDFTKYGNESLVYDAPETHLQLWLRLLSSDVYSETINDGVTWRNFRLEFFLFDYFNKLCMVFEPHAELPIILLSKDKPTNYRFTSRADVIAVINKLNTAFRAIDADRIEPAELDLSKKLDCQWLYDGFFFRLEFNNGFLQLYLDLPDRGTPPAG